MPRVRRDLLPRDLVSSVRQYHPDPRTGACCHVRNIKTIPMLHKSEGGMALCILTLPSGIDCDTLIGSFSPRRQRLRAALMSIASLLRIHAPAEICRRGGQRTWPRCLVRAFARKTRQISATNRESPCHGFSADQVAWEIPLLGSCFHTQNLSPRI